MRHWKIRTKMFAGFVGLALVIVVLVYNMYAQLSRDRYLSVEISHLADDIHFSHELNKHADRLAGTYNELHKLQSVDHSMIEQDLIASIHDADVQGLRSQLNDGIDIELLRLSGLIEDYQLILQEDYESDDRTSLLLDRNDHGVRLDAIAKEVQDTRIEWERSQKLERELLTIDYLHASLDQRLQDLVHLTDAHLDSIESGMRDFRESVHAKQSERKKSFWAVTLFSIAVLGFLIWQFWIGIVAPFRILFRGSELIANGHHHHEIELGRKDELGQMAETVNDITRGFNRAWLEVKHAKDSAEQEVRDRTREVIQNEQLASVGFLAAGVAHEINNPLGAIAWSAESVEDELRDLSPEARSMIEPGLLAELETNLGLIQKEAYRCKGITQRLLKFSKLSDSTREQENVSELVRHVVAMVGKVGEYRCKTVIAHANDDVYAYCNAQEIQQVILNLVSNALESVDTDGRVDVFVRGEVDPLSGLEHATVVVKDNGCGMTNEVMDHLFQPFFTRRRDNTGTGLGLSISYRIVSLHHGSLTPHSGGEGMGSEMILRLPTQPPRGDFGDDDADEYAPIASNVSPSRIALSPATTQAWKHVEEAA
ncbi:MAG: ATP-binding protein [Planctomycetota bacterium]